MSELERAVQVFLAGRLWLRSAFPFPSTTVTHLHKTGKIQRLAGIVTDRTNRPLCNRCTNTTPSRFTTFLCAVCKGSCMYCRNCLIMGRVSSCSELLRWTGEPLQFTTTHRFAWPYTLTDLQERAAQDLQRSFQKQQPHLLYAVCGAGKTEMIYPAILMLLRAGKRVGVVAPRVDVVVELAHRLREVFPDTSMAVYHGGVKTTHGAAQLIVATTHQLYRFEAAFDAIFIDEVDAFPYSIDETLQQVVQRAAKQQAVYGYISATPSPALVRQCQQQGGVSIIHQRFHGFPLPEPEFSSLWRYERSMNKGVVPMKLRQWIQKRLQRLEPFLLFFHQIAFMQHALPLLQGIHPHIQAVHAADPNRHESIQALRDGRLKGLLTTTILERGITIPNVQVAVIGAEQAIFTTSALIQIGGRVGRSKQYPAGELVFFHAGITRAMDEARRIIRQMNRGGTP